MLRDSKSDFNWTEIKINVVFSLNFAEYVEIFLLESRDVSLYSAVSHYSSFSNAVSSGFSSKYPIFTIKESLLRVLLELI